jgi:queuine tRNA-ribosyltransferase
MGVGTPENILECIALGVDMFDCVMPTRNGRNGMLFTTEGIINIKNEKWKFDHSPVDPGLVCFASQEYSKSYLRHLFISGEILALQIASVQNLSFYMNLVKQAAQNIEAQCFNSWKGDAKIRYMQRL